MRGPRRGSPLAVLAAGDSRCAPRRRCAAPLRVTKNLLKMLRAELPPGERSVCRLVSSHRGAAALRLVEPQLRHDLGPDAEVRAWEEVLYIRLQRGDAYARRARWVVHLVRQIALDVIDLLFAFGPVERAHLLLDHPVQLGIIDTAVIARAIRVIHVEQEVMWLGKWRLEPEDHRIFALN